MTDPVAEARCGICGMPGDLYDTLSASRHSTHLTLDDCFAAVRADERERCAKVAWLAEKRKELAGVHHCDACLGIVPNEWRSEFQSDLCDGCYAAAIRQRREGD